MTQIDLSRAAWRTSRRSQQNGECVQVATPRSGVVAIRDSKQPDGPVLMVSPGQWRGFVQQLLAAHR
ncbi:MAG TPA: DUF397 domain-containing protein [Streptosporangiaceae bacterium]|jgi:hypothetical protein